MASVNDIAWCLIFAAIAALLFLKHRQVEEALEAFRNNFPRGGPGTPMHPSPSVDGALLRRRPRTRPEK